MNSDQIIKALKRLEKGWPKDSSLMLFGHAGTLSLVSWEHMEILETFAIDCDGGDPDVVEVGDASYLDFGD